MTWKCYHLDFLRRIQGLSSGGSRELGFAKPCLRAAFRPRFQGAAKLIARLGFQSLSCVQRWSHCRSQPLSFVGETLRPMAMALHAPCAHLKSGLLVRLREAFAHWRYRPFSVIVTRASCRSIAPLHPSLPLADNCVLPLASP